MKRLFTALSVFVFCTTVLAARPASAQVSAADAAPYLGSWTLHMVGQMLGQFEAGLKISTEGGKVVGEVVSGPLGTPKSTDAVKNDKGLTLKLIFDFMGMPVAGSVILEPDGAKYRATIDIMDGFFQIPGEATKDN